MPNDYFRFKQFTIHQDRCAMKVTSLACIQGAWLPENLNPQHVLDIGAGTGLLTLMAAQKYHAGFDAVEVDALAYVQMNENFRQSPWSDRIMAFNMDIRDFAKESSIKYDLIVCNPPFYRRHLESPNKRINMARHQSTLDIKTLILLVSGMLSDRGLFSVLLPTRESIEMLRIAAKQSLWPQEQLNIAHQVGNRTVATVTLMSKAGKIGSSRHLFIKDETGNFTNDYIRMLRPYYLNL